MASFKRIAFVAADTTPAVTEAPTTSTIPGPQGWVATDLSGEPGPLAYPCCGSNWYGPASPPLPTDLADIADREPLAHPRFFEDVGKFVFERHLGFTLPGLG